MEKIEEEEGGRGGGDRGVENKLERKMNKLEKKDDDFVGSKGKGNGFGCLDGNGLVGCSELGCYVDDVMEGYGSYDMSESGKVRNIKLYCEGDDGNGISGE